MLNEQAFAMNTYINVYFERLAQCKKKNVDMVKFYFRQATKDHPLFQEETDLEYVEPCCLRFVAWPRYIAALQPPRVK